MEKTEIEALQENRRRLSKELHETERELRSITDKETKKMADFLIGRRIKSARYYNNDEGYYVLTMESGSKVTFSATGDCSACVTMEIEVELKG